MENTDFIDLTEIGKRIRAVGRTTKHLTRNLRAAGYTLHKIHRKRGRSSFAITKDEAEKFLSTYERVLVKETNPIIEAWGRVEERVRQQREDTGWFSFRLSSPGMPDLINLKPCGDGVFEVLFEEVKGPGDGLRKEQHAVLQSLKEKGIPATLTWL